MAFRRTVGLVAVLVSVSSAADCPLPAGLDSPGLRARTDAQRLHFLASTLEAEGARARLWVGAWGGANAALTVAQLALLPVLGPDDQQDFVVGAVASAIGVAFALSGVPEVAEAGDPFATQARSGKDECALITRGEALLARDARTEEAGVSWFMHAGNVGFNVAVGLILGLGLRHWVSAGINTALGLAIGEATILTQPTGLVGAWAAYQRGELDRPGVSLHLVPLVLPGGGGLGVALSF